MRIRRAGAASAALVVGALLLLSGQAVSAQGGDRDCGDFSSQAAAQAALVPGDPERLDANNNGVACETFEYPDDSVSGGTTAVESMPAPPPIPDPVDTTVIETGASPEVTIDSGTRTMPEGAVPAGFGGTADEGASEGGGDGGDSRETMPWRAWVYGAGMLLTAVGVTQWWRSRRG